MYSHMRSVVYSHVKSLNIHCHSYSPVSMCDFGMCLVYLISVCMCDLGMYLCEDVTSVLAL